jgi:putative ABC transport system substrate-binding protein
MIRRREFIKLLGGAAVAWPLAGRAQQPAMPPVGYLNAGAHTDDAGQAEGFRQGLRETGYIEGRNVAVEYRWAENQYERLPALAADLVRRQVRVLVTSPNLTSLAAAKAATASIPIVFLSGPDPVRAGLVAGINQAGGNLTGVFQLTAELTAKRLGLLYELVPQAKTIAMLLDGRPEVRGNQDFNLNEAESAGRSQGLRVVGVWASGDSNFEPALTAALQKRADAVLVSTSIFFINHRNELVAAVARHGLPAIYQSRVYPVIGGLMSYGADLSDGYRQVGNYAGRILKGAKPSELPVIQPTKFELILNLKTAKRLGLEIPSGVSAIADEVIE